MYQESLRIANKGFKEIRKRAIKGTLFFYISIAYHSIF
jgi:hypothetical protein